MENGLDGDKRKRTKTTVNKQNRCERASTRHVDAILNSYSSYHIRKRHSRGNRGQKEKYKNVNTPTIEMAPV